jgi:uncharacterized protein (TIRG00374 family)
MKKTIFSILKYLFFLGIGVFLTWWQISKMTPLQKVQFKDSLIHAHYIYILPVFVLTILSHISRAVRWKLLIEPMGYKPKTSNTFYAVMGGYFANTFLPRAGEILRCTLLSKYDKIPVSKLFGTILVERVFDLLCYFLFLVITLVIQIETVSDFVAGKLSQISDMSKSISLWSILLVIIILLAVIFFISRHILIKYKDHHFVVKLKGIHLGLK